MKKVILFFILLISANPIFADPAPKQRKIKFTPTAYYEGMAVDKNPQGQGVLYPCSRCVVTGTFDNNRIRNGKISFSDHNLVITGDFSFAVMGQEQFWVIVNDGIIVRSKTKMPANTPIKFNGENYNFESHYKTFPRMPKSYYELLKQFAGETEYQRASDGRAKRVYNNENSTRVQIQKATYLKVYFVNGVIANYTVADRKNLWTRPNGDFIEFTSTAEGE
ncbi:MAG: hypothetical protein II214_07230, partial [Alistipes sp.]|nr:hypothetical protein [Alistipes sp.]